jgi:beta-glucanase (GH16 family)
MALTQTQITQAQAELRDIATVLRQKAEALAAIADVLSAPISPAVTPPAPTPNPAPLPASGFTGRSVVDSSKWKLVWANDFGTNCTEGQFLTTYAKSLSAYPADYKDTQGQQGNGSHYNPDRISVVDGWMKIRVGFGPDGKAQAAAPYALNSSGKILDQLYGRYEVRMRAEPVPGFKLASLLWPKSDVWAEGEIDFPEGSLNGNVTAYSHYVGDPQNQDAFENTGAKMADTHTYTVEWMPNKVEFFVDGKSVGTSTKKVMATPAHWIYQVESNIGGNLPTNGPTGSVYIDHMSIWSLT